VAAARAGAAAAAATAVAGVSAAWCLLRSPCTQSRHTPRHWCQCHAPERRRGAVDAPRGYHADSAVHSQTCSTSPTAVHSCPQLSTVVYIYSCPYLPYTPHTPLIHPSYTPHTPLIHPCTPHTHLGRLDPAESSPRGRSCARRAWPNLYTPAAPSCSSCSSSTMQGLTLVNFSAQPEPFLTENAP
jgi:hypothetical protein